MKFNKEFYYHTDAELWIRDKESDNIIDMDKADMYFKICDKFPGAL